MCSWIDHVGRPHLRHHRQSRAATRPEERGAVPRHSGHHIWQSPEQDGRETVGVGVGQRRSLKTLRRSEASEDFLSAAAERDPKRSAETDQ